MLRFRAVACPPLRPAAFFWAVVPPCFAVLRVELLRDELLREELLRDVELEPDFLPPRLDAPGEFAIFAARSFDIPFSFSFSYCFSFLTFARFPGIADPLFRDFLDRVTDVLLVAFAGNIGLGENADEPAALDDGQAADLVLRHQLQRLVEVAVGLDRDGVG